MAERKGGSYRIGTTFRGGSAWTPQMRGNSSMWSSGMSQTAPPLTKPMPGQSKPGGNWGPIGPKQPSTMGGSLQPISSRPGKPGGNWGPIGPSKPRGGGLQPISSRPGGPSGGGFQPTGPTMKPGGPGGFWRSGGPLQMPSPSRGPLGGGTVQPKPRKR